MSTYVDRIVARLRDAEEDLLGEVEAQQARWNYRVQRRRVWFDRELKQAHRRLRQSVPAFIAEGSFLSLLTAPVIYSLFLPFFVLDVWVTLYQWICFPAYGIARVRRRDYFTVDRHKLDYLNVIEKAHCVYCGYVSGFIAYVREIVARTEQYWCPIRHATPIPAPHQRYHLFFDYGDAEGYRRNLGSLRETLRPQRRVRRKGRGRPGT
ncbi:MAG: hypothetical protein ABL971_16590 [Vicinamibacterales bacterium]